MLLNGHNLGTLQARCEWLRREIGEWLENDHQFGIIEILHGDKMPHGDKDGHAITKALSECIDVLTVIQSNSIHVGNRR